jgi:hypothetical protein
VSPPDLPPGIAGSAEFDGPQVTLAAHDPVPALRELTAWAAERGTALPGLEVRPPSLEDIYLELTS